MLAHWWLGQSRREELTGPAAIRLEGLWVVLPGRRNLRAKKTAGVTQAVLGFVDSWPCADYDPRMESRARPALTVIRGGRNDFLSSTELTWLLEEVDVTEALEYFRNLKRQRSRPANSPLAVLHATTPADD